mgnify:CR=1 FL=1
MARVVFRNDLRRQWVPRARRQVLGLKPTLRKITSTMICITNGERLEISVLGAERSAGLTVCSESVVDSWTVARYLRPSSWHLGMIQKNNE